MKTPALLLLLAAACGGSSSSSSSDDQAALAGAPPPFALQFTGTYLGGGPLSRLELRPDGSYRAQLSGGVERGRYFAARVKKLPLQIHFIGRTLRRASVTAYDGKLHLDAEALLLQRPATSDEELCDGTGGHWTDDDADPLTGLYCVCPAPAQFIPASGGCASG